MQKYEYSTFRIIFLISMWVTTLLLIECSKTDGFIGFFIGLNIVLVFKLYGALHPPSDYLEEEEGDDL